MASHEQATLAQQADATGVGLAMTFPSATASPIAPQGSFLGRYRIEGVVGQGGMGIVYGARDTLLGRKVAVKSLLPSPDTDDLTPGLRFLREAEVLALMQHPHIVRVFDAGEHQGRPFMVLEYLEGEHLGAHLRRSRRLRVEETLQLLMPAIGALDYAHRQGILHLDLKPSNIFLARDDLGRIEPKLLDFGVCMLSGLTKDLDPTQDACAGTPQYMPPEALSGEERTSQSDVFSLGVMLYECLSGVNPYARQQTFADVIISILERRHPRLETLCPQLPSSLIGIIDRALHPEPSERFAGPASLARALLEFAPVAIASRWRAELSHSGDASSGGVPHSTARAKDEPATLSTPLRAAAGARR